MIELDQLVREPTRDNTPPSPGAAIALSGGGYRAMLFHTGVLWRLGQFGFFSGQPLQGLTAPGKLSTLGPLARVSSVSGGSIVSAVLGLAMAQLKPLSGAAFDEAFQSAVVAPVRRQRTAKGVGNSYTLSAHARAEAAG